MMKSDVKVFLGAIAVFLPIALFSECNWLSGASVETPVGSASVKGQPRPWVPDPAPTYYVTIYQCGDALDASVNAKGD